MDNLSNVIDKKDFIEREFHNICSSTDIYTPAIIRKKVDRIIVLGDIHGDYEMTLDLLKKAELIEIKPHNKIIWKGKDTYVVQVGDQIDRCRPMNGLTCNNPKATDPDEASDIKILKLFNDLDRQARQHNGRVISLLGNHELMNVMGDLNYVSYENIKDFENYKDPTNPYMKFNTPYEARRWAFAPGNEYAKMLGCTRLACVIIGSNLFVHAGIVDGLIRELNINKDIDLDVINIAISKWLHGMINQEYIDKIVAGSKNSMFWNRILGSIPPEIGFENDVCQTHIKDAVKILKIGSMIIGHTPQSFIYSDGINKTCGNTIWRVDNGSSAAFDKFEDKLMTSGEVTISRKPQVLEILNDKQFRIIK